MDFPSRRGIPFGKFLAPILISGLLIFWNPQFLSFALQNILSTVAFPVQNVISFAGFHIREFTSFLGSIGDVKQEREALVLENAELRARNALLSDVKQENEILRKEIGLLPRDRFSLLEAEVIGRESGSAGGRLSINIGSRDGIAEGMAVVVGDGILIGRISGVGALSSGVLLVSHPESSINAIEGKTGALGIVRGEYGIGLVFDMVLQTDSLIEGDDVVTSGLGGGIPRGLLIGAVARRESSSDRLFQRATLVSPIQVDEIRFVSVVLGDS